MRRSWRNADIHPGLWQAGSSACSATNWLVATTGKTFHFFKISNDFNVRYTQFVMAIILSNLYQWSSVYVLGYVLTCVRVAFPGRLDFSSIYSTVPLSYPLHTRRRAYANPTSKRYLVVAPLLRPSTRMIKWRTWLISFYIWYQFFSFPFSFYGTFFHLSFEKIIDGLRLRLWLLDTQISYGHRLLLYKENNPRHGNSRKILTSIIH